MAARSPWSLLGQALLAPVIRLDRVVAFFWPLLLFAALCLAGAYFGVRALLRGLANNTDTTVQLLSWANPLVLVSVQIIVAIVGLMLTVPGLVRWHRLFALSQSDGGPADARRGRSWPLFVNWFIVGLAFALVVFAVSLPMLIFVSPVLLLSAPHLPQTIEALRMFLLVGSALNLAIVLAGAYLFAMTFQKRSLLLAYIAVDHRPEGETLPIDAIPANRPDSVLPFALSIAAPLVLASLPGLILTFMQGFDAVFAKPELRIVPLRLAAELGMGVVQFLYPMLVFAAFVSLYYRTFARDELLAKINSPQATASP